MSKQPSKPHQAFSLQANGVTIQVPISPQVMQLTNFPPPLYVICHMLADAMSRIDRLERIVATLNPVSDPMRDAMLGSQSEPLRKDLEYVAASCARQSGQDTAQQRGRKQPKQH